MNRYVVLGITSWGGASRLANRRGTTPNEVIEQALVKARRLVGGYDQIILVSVGEEHGEIGDALNVDTYLIKEVPRPAWELVKI